MPRPSHWYLSSVVLALVACESGIVAPTAPESVPSAGGGGAAVESPSPQFAASSGGWESGVIVEEFVAPNSCTGELATFTFTGQMKVEQRGGFYHLIAHGTVETSDGWTGRFNRTFVIIDDKVFVVRFHDMEVQADPAGPKQVWSVGMGHETLASGETHDYFERYGNSGCRGAP